MGALSLNQLAARCGARLLDQDVYFDSVSTDSRKIQKGDLFFAIRGDRFDGHDFMAAVADSGACAAVVEKRQACELPQLVVDNSVTALGELGALNRDQFSGKLIAVTGSSGKTTVKEMLASILATQGKVLATRGNFNNHLGMPLTLLQIGREHRFAVIEMGASAIGEIAYMARLAKPEVSVVNNVGTAHVEGFGSVANIAKGKGEIYQYLPEQGVAVINLDDTYSGQWIEQNRDRTRLTFSVSQPADVLARNIQANHIQQYSFSLCHQQREVLICLSLVGRHNVANALAAATCAVAVGVDLEDIKRGLETVQPVTGRMQVKKGVAGACVIDDTYNANPTATRAAIDVLAGMTGKKILVLGSMAELGELSDSLHSEIGAYAKQKNIHKLLATGDATKHCVKIFSDNASWFADKDSLAKACVDMATPETVFLVKGSRSAAMEDVVEKLTC
jgi:UDP-N-acetylmuramoyl-tripeptide--D-alanyl-D-alanine ligase